MRRMAAIYRQYMRIAFSSSAAYRLDFILTQIITLAGNLLVPLLTVLIYSNGVEIPGWNFYEALLIQSVFMLCTGICAPFFKNMVWTTMWTIKEGSYDLLMLKPCSLVFVTAAASFAVEYIGSLIGGIAMFTYSLAHLPAPTVASLLSFFFLLLMGMCMYLGCILLMSASCFKWVGNGRIFEIYEALTMFGRYPGTVFSGGLRAALTFVFPAAMLGFFPAAAILGRSTWEMMAAAVPCVAFLALGWLVFRRMIYLYQSAGG